MEKVCDDPWSNPKALDKLVKHKSEMKKEREGEKGVKEEERKKEKRKERKWQSEGLTRCLIEVMCDH